MQTIAYRLHRAARWTTLAKYNKGLSVALTPRSRYPSGGFRGA